MKWGKLTYCILLLYIIVSIIFWGLSLQKQSNIIEDYELRLVQLGDQPFASTTSKRSSQEEIKERSESRSRQFIGEGAAILIVTLFGAYVVYASMQRQKKLSEVQNNFMMSVTHELKSPIAGIKLNLQTLGRPNLPEEKKGILLHRSISEADRLNDLCNNLLLATQMEGNRAIFNIEVFDFSELCRQCIEEFSNRSTHRIKADITEGLTTCGDRVMWKIALNNLIENAIKYSPEESPITIRLSLPDNQIVLQVADEGIGIADDEKGKIYNKFYRIGDENSRKTKGTGLGLFLTSSIVKQHNASIVVSDNQPKGTVFEITLERAY